VPRHESEAGERVFGHDALNKWVPTESTPIALLQPPPLPLRRRSTTHDIGAAHYQTGLDGQCLVGGPHDATRNTQRYTHEDCDYPRPPKTYMAGTQQLTETGNRKQRLQYKNACQTHIVYCKSCFCKTVNALPVCFCFIPLDLTSHWPSLI